MAILMEYKPGASLTRPLNFSLTSRTAPGFQHGSNGYLKSAAATVVRDSHWYNGVRTTLLEASSANSCLQSQTFDTTWAPQQASVSSNNSTGPDGTLTADKLVENSAGPTAHYILQGGITITADEFVSASMYVKSVERFRGRFLIYDFIGGQASSQVTMTFRLDTGVITTSGTSGTGVLVSARLVQLGNGWWRVELSGKLMGGLTNLGIIIAMHDASGNESYTGDGSSGWLLWGAQVERWGTLVPGQPTSYVATTTGTVTRGADNIFAPWPYPVQPMWFYMRFFDLGWSARANFESGPAIAKNSNFDRPRLRMMTGSGTAGQTPNHRWNWEPNLGPSGANQAAATVNVAVAHGDDIELFGRFISPGRVEITRTVNGGSLTTTNVNAAGGIPYLDFGTAPYLFLNNSATIALRVLRIGSDPLRITTLALAAAQ